MIVTANLFPLLGTPPQLGQGFSDNDDRAQAGGVALISDSLWRRRYASDRSAIGRIVRLDNVAFTIVGVMPPRFRFPITGELWIPLTPALGPSGAATRGLSVIGRLAPDATLERANTELSARVLPARGSRAVRSGFAPSPWLTVIGVIPDIRTVKLDESRATPPTAYLPHRLISTRNYGIVVVQIPPRGTSGQGGYNRPWSVLHEPARCDDVLRSAERSPI